MILRKFCPPHEKEQMAAKFLNHKMIGLNCREFTTKFFEYARMVPALASPEPVLISRYIWGLVSEICDLVKAARPQTIGETVELANSLTDGLIRTQEENTKKELAQKITQKLRSGETYKKKGAGQLSTLPFCRICKKKHAGRCPYNKTLFCNFCKIPGHKRKRVVRRTVSVTTAEKQDIFVRSARS